MQIGKEWLDNMARSGNRRWLYSQHGDENIRHPLDGFKGLHVTKSCSAFHVSKISRIVKSPKEKGKHYSKN